MAQIGHRKKSFGKFDIKEYGLESTEPKEQEVKEAEQIKVVKEDKSSGTDIKKILSQEPKKNKRGHNLHGRPKGARNRIKTLTRDEYELLKRQAELNAKKSEDIKQEPKEQEVKEAEQDKTE